MIGRRWSLGQGTFFYYCFTIIVLALGVGNATDTCEEIIAGKFEMGLRTGTFCYQLRESSDIGKAFSCVKISVNCSKCEILHGSEFADVQDSGLSASSIAYAFFRVLTAFSSGTQSQSNEQTSICLSPFKKQYIKVKNSSEYCKITISTVLDKACVACMLVGIILFLYAERLSSSVKFYYTSGVGVGILASLLVLTFILSRAVPKKPAMYAILIGGWSFTAWLFKSLWNNWNILLKKYFMYFLMYIGVTGFCSFIFCYWFGPIRDPRSQNIMKWSLQLIALFLIYNGSQLSMISVSFVLVMAVIKLQSERDLLKSFAGIRVWSTKSKPPRLLTEEEYKLQAEVETKKALEELRQFCHSPQCSPWKTLSRMKSPERFVEFMDGKDHVTDAEVTLHDADFSDSELSDVITDEESEVANVVDNIEEKELLISDDDSS